MPSILITRPQHMAASLFAKLESFGYACFFEPLLTIAPGVAPPPEIFSVGAVMITSGNALYMLEANGEKIASLAGLPCFCVGPRTAERARAFGFRDVKYAAGDGLDLARLIHNTVGNDASSILHICGEDIDSKAQDELQRMGRAVVTWPVYRAVAVEALSSALCQSLKERKLDAALLFSPRTAQVLVGLLQEAGIEACCESFAAIGLSAAVTGALKPLAWRKLMAAPVPTEDAVIACLKEICPIIS